VLRSLAVSLCLLLAAAPRADADTLDQILGSIAADPALAHAQWAFKVVDLDTGRTLADRYPAMSLAPASVLKVVTSATALSVLGPDYRFETRLAYTGSIDDDGRLRGDLIILGGGDPSLGTDRFGDAAPNLPGWLAQAVERVRAAGITAIDGAVVGDGSAVSGPLLPASWTWADLGNYYAAGADGLNIHENLYHLTFRPGGSVGAATEVLRTEPAIPAVRFVNEVTTGPEGSGDNAYIYGSPWTELRVLRGTVPLGPEEFSIKGSLPEAPLAAAAWLTDALRDAGVAVADEPTTARRRALAGGGESGAKGQGEPTVIWTHRSPPLSELVYWLNKRSINLYAEAMLKAMGREHSGVAATEAGIAAVKAHWMAKGVTLEGCHMEDGSGLSSYNAVTPEQLTAVLRVMARDPAFADFERSLPVAGDPDDPGHLRSLLRGTAGAGNVRAKSGYITRVLGYAGYVTDAGGRRLAFAVIANRYSGSTSAVRRQFERLMRGLAELRGPGAD